MGQDEAGTMAALKSSRRKEVLEPLVGRHEGRIFKVTGDGVLIEFGSPVNAVRCAVALQHGMAAANGELPEDRRIVLGVAGSRSRGRDAGGGRGSPGRGHVTGNNLVIATQLRARAATAEERARFEADAAKWHGDAALAALPVSQTVNVLTNRRRHVSRTAKFGK